MHFVSTITASMKKGQHILKYGSGGDDEDKADESPASGIGCIFKYYYVYSNLMPNRETCANIVRLSE